MSISLAPPSAALDLRQPPLLLVPLGGGGGLLGGVLGPPLPDPGPLRVLLFLGGGSSLHPLGLGLLDAAPLLPHALPESLFLRRAILEALQGHIIRFGEHWNLEEATSTW